MKEGRRREEGEDGDVSPSRMRRQREVGKGQLS